MGQLFNANKSRKDNLKAGDQLDIGRKKAEGRVGALTDVWVLEQSADPGFSLQLLVVYKTITPQHISARRHPEASTTKKMKEVWRKPDEFGSTRLTLSGSWRLSSRSSVRSPGTNRCTSVKEPEGHARPRCTFNPSFRREGSKERGRIDRRVQQKHDTKLPCGDVRDCLYLFSDVIDRIIVDAAAQMSQQCHNVFILSAAQKRKRGAKAQRHRSAFLLFLFGKTFLRTC